MTENVGFDFDKGPGPRASRFFILQYSRMEYILLLPPFGLLFGVLDHDMKTVVDSNMKTVFL